MTLQKTGITTADNIKLAAETLAEQITETRELDGCSLHILESGEVIVDAPASTMWYESLTDAQEGQPGLEIVSNCHGCGEPVTRGEARYPAEGGVYCPACDDAPAEDEQ